MRGRAVIRWLVPLLMAGVLAACSSPRWPDFVELAEEASPAVVNVGGYPKEADGPDDLATRATLPKSLGSGVLISANGEILTNKHVVDQAGSIVITLHDRRRFSAAVIGVDAASDLALLKIDADDVPYAKLRRGEDVRVGAWVMAIGSPFGLEHSVTVGVVSAQGRSLRKERYVPFLQTDVAINPGNSGGPLIDTDGRIVGINSQIYSRTGANVGVAFAVPSSTVRRVVDDLREYGEVRRGWLGVAVQRIDASLADTFELDSVAGALVTDVLPGGPAAASDIRVGDVIVAVDDDAVVESSDLPPLVGRHDPGDKVVLRILRNGRIEHRRIRLDQVPASDSDAPELGLALRPARASELRRLELDNGLIVEAVVNGSVAASAGLLSGDALVSVNGQAMVEVGDWERVLRAQQPGDTVALLVRRDGQSLFLALTVPES